MMTRWPGHSPITKSVLLALLERAAEGNSKFSRSERLLYAACEFWAAVSTGQLGRYLETDGEDRLRTAQDAFSEIGAAGLASDLRAVMDGWTGTSAPPPWRRQYTVDLESRLRATDDPVDQLITNYAVQCAASAAMVGPPPDSSE